MNEIKTTLDGREITLRLLGPTDNNTFAVWETATFGLDGGPGDDHDGSELYLESASLLRVFVKAAREHAANHARDRAEYRRTNRWPSGGAPDPLPTPTYDALVAFLTEHGSEVGQ